MAADVVSTLLAFQIEKESFPKWKDSGVVGSKGTALGVHTCHLAKSVIQSSALCPPGIHFSQKFHFLMPEVEVIDYISFQVSTLI